MSLTLTHITAISAESDFPTIVAGTAAPSENVTVRELEFSTT